MRVSTWLNDPGYHLYRKAARGWMVTLDGQEITMVFMADEERGEVVRAVLDEAGHLVIDGDEVATETLRGVVRVERKRC